MITSDFIFPSSSNESNLKSVKTFVLPGKDFSKGIGLVWGSGNNFSIYTRGRTAISKDSPVENKILNIRQETPLFSSILRKLVNEANGTYLSLQKVAEAAKTSDNQVEFLKISRQYRSIIRVCIESLQEAAEKETDGLEKNKLFSYITIFYSIECVWHLCEILFIDVIPAEVVLPFLLEWVRFHFPSHEQTAAQLLEACERGSEDHAEYWDTVTGMVVQGRVDVARALLKLHSLADSTEFKLIDSCMRNMPIFNVYGGISTGEFTVTWKHWQAECRNKLSSRALIHQPQLELILRLMTGEYAAFESVRPKYSSWFDVLGGWVLFSAPWARRRELAAAAAACAGLAPAARSPLDLMVRALLDGDLYQLIYEIQQISDNGWFATHLTDLLYQCGKLQILDRHQIDVTTRLRDSLVLEYGSLIMGHRSLWPVGLSYLASCPPEGLKRAELLLERISIKTDAKALRVIAEANKYGLGNVVWTVCGVCGARSLRGGRVGAALAWGARARGARAVAAAAGAALRRYRAAAALPAADLLLTAGGALLLGTQVLLLGKYCEFHRLYSNREFKKAAKLLVSLITSNIAPDYFWDTLLLDTLPLLESEEPVISAEDTYEIMLCLELKSEAISGEKAELLRLALARNLARTSLIDFSYE